MSDGAPQEPIKPRSAQRLHKRSSATHGRVSVHDKPSARPSTEPTSPAAVSRIDQLCQKHGVAIEALTVENMPAPVATTADDALKNLREAKDGSTARRDGLINLVERDMRGVVGTPIFSGLVSVEHAAEYSAWSVRGSTTNAGLYEEIRRSESMVYDAIQSITELVASATPIVRMPNRVRQSQLSEMRDFVERQQSAINRFRCLEGGWRKAVEEILSFALKGFCIMEPTFRKVKGGWVWSRAEPRIQQTVRRWIQHGDRLVATEHVAVTAPEKHKLQTNSYTLPVATGPKAWQRHLTLWRIGSYGNDWEGCPPTRPSLHWVKFKRLIAQIVPLAAEKYGVPITYLRHDPAFMNLIQHGRASDLPDLGNAWEVFVEMLAEDLPVFEFGDGVVAETIAAQGAMPTLDDWIRYCDMMIGYPFSNEGNLLGLQSATGSYAQAEVRERRFLRSAPFYAAKVVEPINEQILKPLVNDQFAEPPIEYPYLELDMTATGDNSAWINDARNLFGPNLPMTKWPDNWRDMASRKMRVPSSGYVLVTNDGTNLEVDADGNEIAHVDAADNVQQTAYNGAQVTALVDIAERVKANLIERSAAIAVLKTAFQMTQQQAEEIVGKAEEPAAAVEEVVA